ncbi:S-type pyocin domain-containing protein [Vibrio spartinae]|uniref:S-type Pyocin n=1 Tax=Vibrio spartinae TaxID=1918945 RepID=A0ABX6R4N8_9VIBR|nr:S-type pyocin domain-containing protein [Vibrio spartinae]QMV16328.1 S-type Pyocin [Vibrio spartinae]
MNYQTIQIYNLMRYEFAQVEGDFSSLNESDIKSVTPAGIRCSDFLDQLRSGHQVLLTDTPSIPLLIRDQDEWGNLYWRVNPEVEPQLGGLAYKAYTARAELVNHGIGSSYAGCVNASVYTEPYVERNQVKLTLAQRLAKQRQERIQELDNIQLPPSSWQDTFNKPAPKPQQVFAKSSLVPCDSCDIGTEQESLTDIGQIAAYGAVAMNNATALTGEATFVEASGSALKSLSGFALRAAKVGLSPATAALALFMPTKVADSTLYHAEDLRHMAVANTNIRLGFNPSGQIYGYHVKGAEIPVRHVKQVGEKFVVALESDHTLEWVPIQPEDKDSHLTTTPIPAVDSYHIWIHPERGEAELAGTNEPYTTPIHPADSKDYILTFPAESGIPPLYVVYSHQVRQPNGQFGASKYPKPELNRTSLRAETKRQIKANARKLNGQFVDEDDNVITDWHYGHREGMENRRILRAADQIGMTQEELNDFVNSHPDYFLIEDAKTNLSHVNEKPGSDDLRKILRDMRAFLKNRKT